MRLEARLRFSDTVFKLLAWGLAGRGLYARWQGASQLPVSASGVLLMLVVQPHPAAWAEAGIRRFPRNLKQAFEAAFNLKSCGPHGQASRPDLTWPRVGGQLFECQSLIPPAPSESPDTMAGAPCSV